MEVKMTESTKHRLLDAGLPMLLERGYNDLGIQALLDATRVPRGSFYHHFESKQGFALQAIDVYAAKVYATLEVCLGDERRAPLERVRGFFEAARESYRAQGYLGCLLGALGQELAGADEVFRLRIERCLAHVAARIAACLREAHAAGELPPETDCALMADMLVDAWEGAALRSRLRRDPAPLDAMLDFHFPAAAPA
jgi:TetR/AcrR family transcriptional regulator, transcriptional repressor for nem operon